MKHIFTNSLAKRVIFRQILLSSFLFVCGVSIILLFVSKIQLVEIQQKIYLLVGIFMVVYICLILPIYFIVCSIHTYKIECDLQIIVDDITGIIEFRKGIVVVVFHMSDIEKWYRCAYRFSIMEIYELHLSSGRTISYSSMIPLYEYYLINQRKKFSLPELEPKGNLFTMLLRKSI